MLNFLFICIVPIMILYILFLGIKENQDVFKLFTLGVLDGLKIVYNIFPFILAITLAIGLLRESGAIKFIIYPIKPLLLKLNIPEDIIPLCILRPLSGGASMSIVIDILKNHGADSISGKMASIIMGATETTLYTITILFGAVNVKNIRGVLIAGLIADFVAICTSILLVNLGIL